MTLYEQSFWRQLDEFKSLQHNGPDAEHARHDRISVNPTNKNQHQVAGQYQYRLNNGERVERGELNSKIEAIRNNQTDTKILSPADVDYIKKEYQIDLTDRKPKELGNSGMVVYIDDTGADRVYKLTKKHE